MSEVGKVQFSYAHPLHIEVAELAARVTCLEEALKVALEELHNPSGARHYGRITRTLEEMRAAATDLLGGGK